MSNVNAVTISGNATREPELKTLPSGTSVAEFAVAVNRRRKDAESGDYIEDVSFFDVSTFGSFADLVARKIKKGDSVTVQGRLEQSRWETPEGDKRSKVRIVANEIDGDWQFRSKDEDNATGAATAAEAAEPKAEAAVPAAADDDIPF
jgi:single-strand DNA-binding protein